ncbi:helix-turn-helix domain-containing protein [Williamsia herbipolensis]|uniref:Helix-turn-helix domain-containing protein n=1 Tax=Williamsia herbipolensis TaxID=1603258 RepID=A0AAU4JYB0_9NOCA|nr:helix-turn-helix domain-containing protein [Williamsia herbipolensis]
MSERVSGVLLDDSDVRTTHQALQVFSTLLEQNGQRPTARLTALIAKYGAYASQIGPNASRNARNVAQQPDSVNSEAYAVIDTAEAARILGISPNGVRDRARRGSIPARRAGGRWIYPAATIIDLAERRNGR